MGKELLYNECWSFSGNMSEGQPPKARARGRAQGRARGVPVVPQQQQAASPQQPASSQQQPGASHQRPASSQQQQAASQQRPASSQQQQAASQQRPASSQQQQAASHQRLASSQQQQAASCQRPASSQQPQQALPAQYPLSPTSSSEQFPSLPQQQQKQPSRSAGRARGIVPKQVQPGASGVQQMLQQQQPPQSQSQPTPQPQQERHEEGACAIDPEIKSVSGAFQGLKVGESKPGNLRRGMMRGRLTVVTPPPKTRPDNLSVKLGVSGTPVKLVTNYYRLTKSTNWSLYQYRVDIPNEERTKVRKGLISCHKDRIGDAYLFDGTMLFVIQKLHPDRNAVIELCSKRHDDVKITMTIRFTNEMLVGDYQYIQLFNIILRNCMDDMKYQLVGREYFDARKSIKMPNYHLEIWPGYSTSILQFENHIMMGIDVSHKVLRSDNVWEFLRACRERHGTDYEKHFQDTMLGAVVFTFYNNKPYRVDDVAFDETPISTFTTKKGQNTSYFDYYHTKYGVEIKDLNQPLLVSRPKPRDIRAGRSNNIILIPELCQMTGINDEMRNNFTLMKAVAAHTRVEPEKRIQSYYNFMKDLGSCEKAQEKLEVWNVQFSQELETVQGRILHPEDLHVGGNKMIRPESGDWSRPLRAASMLRIVKLKNWIVIASKQATYDKRVRGNPLDNFLSDLYKAAGTLKFKFDEPEVIIIDQDKISNYLGAIDKAMSASKLQLVMCIINYSRNDLYAAIKKKCLCDRPIPSQVIATKTLGHKNLLSVCTKIAIQINCKLGGSPWFTPVPFKENIVRNDGTVLENMIHAIMIVGFDVCHDTRLKGQSVGAMVASLDYMFSQFYSSVSRHNLGEELSNDIANHISCAVMRFQELNQYLPPKIVVFRDGVGESNINYVKEHEIKRIKERLLEMFPNRTPRLTVIIVSKRIQARFFMEDRKGKYLNPLPGTVVDDVITQPEKYDFFLVSQSVRQGTVTPTNYNVIFDECNMKPDHVQRLAYKMCHLYYNCTSTVRVPCQVQYAHKLAFLVGQVIHIPPNPVLDHLLYFL
ncbi:piwi-like protein Siwi isoform X2 [Halyomorpha halys]|uniref:piwi-like protein Siwi isoform X2 n=1 Tax=Halyomorpha halys TaxID=286706 RepID=UPI0006D4DDE7